MPEAMNDRPTPEREQFVRLLVDINNACMLGRHRERQALNAVLMTAIDDLVARVGEAENAVWDKVVFTCGKAWPEKQNLVWGGSPTELITEIIDERDAALARVEELERKDENWHRWLSEVLTDWRVEFDHHTIGVRHALACFLADQQAGKQAALARVKAMRPYLQHAEWCGTPAYGQMLVSNSIVHGNRLPVGGQGSCVEFNYERICTCGLDAAINQERPGTGTA
jgi:hypothetical protein